MTDEPAKIAILRFSTTDNGTQAMELIRPLLLLCPRKLLLPHHIQMIIDREKYRCFRV